VSDKRYDGKVAWVTGGASGFGAGVSRRLAGLGASVVVSDVDVDGGEKVAADIGGRFIRCDVSSYDDNTAAVDAVVGEHGRLDIAFLNAGISTGAGIGEDFDPERYRRAMGVNLDGVVFGLHATLAAVGEHGGNIVATASLAGLTAVPFDPVYGANKHAVVGLVRAVGAAYADKRTFVNAICPGFADTNILSAPAREALGNLGIPLLSVDNVADAFFAAIESGEGGQCWYIQAGRPIEPFRFRNLPGPRDDDGGSAPAGAGQVGSALTDG
jgi:NAD(P)-dependent dehydrogenase (short-subunit alcohol dehydrogenase family)